MCGALYIEKIRENTGTSNTKKNYYPQSSQLTGNDKALEQFKLYRDDGEASNFIREMIDVCTRMPDIANASVVVGGNKLGRESFNINSGEGGLAFRVEISSKKVGPDDGKYVAFHIGSLFNFYKEQWKNNI